MIAPRHVMTRVVRIPAPGGTAAEPGTPPTSPAGLRALADPAALHAAAAWLGDPGSVDAIGLASTTMGYVLGHTAEVSRLEQLSQQVDVPVFGTSAAAVAALRVLDVDRLQLVHPPWFDDEMNDLGAAYFQEEGFDVVEVTSAELPNDPERIDADEAVAWMSQHVSDEAQAVFVGGNGFRVAAAVARTERQVGRPVLTSNQVLLWSLLRQLPASTEVSGSGSLFQH